MWDDSGHMLPEVIEEATLTAEREADLRRDVKSVLQLGSDAAG